MAARRQRLFQGISFRRPKRSGHRYRRSPERDDDDGGRRRHRIAAGGHDGEHAARCASTTSSALAAPAGAAPALSIALTLCRGRSHDDYYFQRPDRITAEPPPPPYVDMSAPTDPAARPRKGGSPRGLRDPRLFAAAACGERPRRVRRRRRMASSASAPAVAAWATFANSVGLDRCGNHPRIEQICDLLTVGMPSRSRRIGLHRRRTRPGLIADDRRDRADPHLTQDQLSERLANTGVLPMFGFPTRVRYLFHKRPQAQLAARRHRRSPARHCHQPVRAGIGNGKGGLDPYSRWRRQLPASGQSGRRDPNPLGPAIPSECAADASRSTPQPAGADMPGLHGPADDYQVVNLSQPADSEPSTAASGTTTARSNGRRGPRGQSSAWAPFPWSARQLRNLQRRRNRLRRQRQQRRALRVRAYLGRELDDARRCSQGRTHRAGGDMPVRSRARSPQSAQQTCSSQASHLAHGVFADPLRVEGRAALYSYGFMLRRAAAVRLDVSDAELKVGLRTTIDAAGGVIGQIFMSDTLENGAGYSTIWARQAEFQALLQRYPVRTCWTPRSAAQARRPWHACQTSCHECMRDYSNLAYHSILDWRLGVDLARLALNPAAAIDFSPAHWANVPGTCDPAAPGCAAGQYPHPIRRIARVGAGAPRDHRSASAMGRAAGMASPCA